MLENLRCPSCGGHMTCWDVLDIDHLSADEHNIVWSARCDDCGREREVWVRYGSTGFDLEEPSCKECAYYVVAKYANGERYEECESENMVLHEDEIESGCKHFTRRRI